MKTKKCKFTVGESLWGPCMICHTGSAIYHGEIEFDVPGFANEEPGKINLLLCEECAKMSDEKVMTKLGFFDKGGR